MSFDIIVLSEIWTYNIDHYCNLFADYNFCYDLCQTSCVGGVGIYVKNRLVHKQLDALKICSTDECKVENLWLEVSTAHQKFIVGVFIGILVSVWINLQVYLKAC